MSYLVSTCYKFHPVPNEKLEELRATLFSEFERLGICGLFILGTEGCNSTIAGSNAAIEEAKGLIATHLGVSDIIFKDSTSLKQPFRRLKVVVRDEIVSLGNPEIFPEAPKNNHLSPKDWHELIEKQGDLITILDTRNHYEAKIGTFKNAIDPNISTFSEFPNWVEKSNIPKDKTVLMFCTGGIRCEKAIIDMQAQGYQSVFQLDGGILNYLKEFPEGFFEGECFVFDHRVAVDSNLQASTRYVLCPHCGDPADIELNCAHCDSEAKVCDICIKKDPSLSTCSKNCAHHYRRKAFPSLRNTRQASR